jgi:nucleotide-binding universal stress UspA family protein
VAETVLVPIDLSEVSARVVDGAGDLAQRIGAGVVLLHVEPPDPAFVGYEVGPKSVRDSVAQDIRKDDERLHALRDRLRAKSVDAESLLIQGPAVEKILEESERIDAGYIVIGSHGHGALFDLVVGSVCDGVVRNAKRPVLVIPRHIQD